MDEKIALTFKEKLLFKMINSMSKNDIEFQLFLKKYEETGVVCKSCSVESWNEYKKFADLALCSNCKKFKSDCVSPKLIEYYGMLPITNADFKINKYQFMETYNLPKIIGITKLSEYIDAKYNKNEEIFKSFVDEKISEINNQISAERSDIVDYLLNQTNIYFNEKVVREDFKLIRVDYTRNQVDEFQKTLNELKNKKNYEIKIVKLKELKEYSKYEKMDLLNAIKSNNRINKLFNKKVQDLLIASSGISKETHIDEVILFNMIDLLVQLKSSEKPFLIVFSDVVLYELRLRTEVGQLIKKIKDEYNKESGFIFVSVNNNGCEDYNVF